jgi:predicted nuclease of predicted toxin-antitoxin system
VRILLDECVDWRLSRAIVGRDVKHTRQMGWIAAKNGELLALAAEHFDVFVTVDQGLPFQQNMRTLGIPIIVLHGRTSRLADPLPLVPDLLAAIGAARFGTVTVVRA